MQLTPYDQLINLTKEELDKKQAPAKIKTQLRKAELKLAELEERKVGLEEQVNKLCSQKDLNFDAIQDALDNLALAERRQKQLEEIIAQLFPKA